ncbi:methylaspartate mutase accessory protein GlmL [Alloiococcus sp. CFN-8]|uniref:methylaspartate mutase accessory protein GlmL n=1 Tax=Alloiococcus sp. CFN-8 TaxID=3416081 RepID=UPI003CF1F6F0
MKAYLLIDFGSTYTKLTAVDIEKEEIIATSKAITTVEKDIMDGFYKAYALLEEGFKDEKPNFIKKLACSSAAGGLKIIAIGLVPELTAEAAKRAALGAGARVMKTYSFELTDDEIEEIKGLKPDMLLLAGGTDGGNKECILYNAELIARSNIGVPVVVAGNKSANSKIRELFTKGNVVHAVCENVMPRLNVINVDPARDEIRKIFMERIIQAKGLQGAEEYTSGVMMPTPAAVLRAARVLSEGSDLEEGYGELIVADIGGATTDIHSIAKGEPSKPGINLRGLEEPYAKRTVEGDLGMRYSALSLWEAVGSRRIKKYLKFKDLKIEEAARFRHENIRFIPETMEEVDFDEAMAKVCLDVSMERHCGYLEPYYSPMGMVYNQVGKDLMETKYIIGTGGVLVHSENPKEILEACVYNTDNINSLKPRYPGFILDEKYILSAMGLLSEDLPDMAVRIMKKYLIQL